MRHARARSLLLLLGWIALVAVTVSLHLLGEGALGGPPLLHPRRILAWWQDRGPVIATFAAVRAALFWVGCYLGTLWTAVVLAASVPSGEAARPLSRCRLPGARTVVAAAFGASAFGPAVVAGAAPSVAVDTGGPASVTPAGPAGGSAGAPVLRYAGPARTPVLRYAGPGEKPAGTTVGVAGADSTAPRRLATPERARRRVRRPPPRMVARGHPAQESAPPSPAPMAAIPVIDGYPTGRWTVRPGDDLWSIAAATLSQTWGRSPAERDLARYWWRVVQANRACLPNPVDPNLLFPGEHVDLPPLPPAPQ